MQAIGPRVVEKVQQTDDVLLSGMVGVCLNNLVEKLDFVNGRFGIVVGRAHDLQCHMLARRVVPGEPNSREMAPAELTRDGVAAVLKRLSYTDGVVAAFTVILRIFFFSSIFRDKARRRGR